MRVLGSAAPAGAASGPVTRAVTSVPRLNGRDGRHAGAGRVRAAAYLFSAAEDGSRLRDREAGEQSDDREHHQDFEQGERSVAARGVTGPLKQGFGKTTHDRMKVVHVRPDVETR